MAVAGALIGGLIGAFGRKPNIPNLPDIDPTKVQGDTIAGNLRNLPEAQKLAAGVDAFNLGQLEKALEFWSPGSLSKLQKTIGSQLSGELDPQDTQALIRNATAVGYGKGFNFASGGIGRNLVLRDLGISGMDQRQRGLQNLMGVQAQTPQPFNVASMFYTPQQRLDFEFNDRQAQFQRNLLNEQVAAAPDPATAALGKEIDRFFNTWANYGMNMLGSGVMGGGGG
jgi:hypothetical protein